jgi:hypothetical protein
MVFQQQAGFTLRQAGYTDIERYAVTKSLDVQRKMEAREVIGKEQYNKWFSRAVAERQNLAVTMKEAWKKLGG